MIRKGILSCVALAIVAVAASDVQAGLFRRCCCRGWWGGGYYAPAYTTAACPVTAPMNGGAYQSQSFDAYGNPIGPQGAPAGQYQAAPPPPPAEQPDAINQNNRDRDNPAPPAEPPQPQQQ